MAADPVATEFADWEAGLMRTGRRSRSVMFACLAARPEARQHGPARPAGRCPLPAVSLLTNYESEAQERTQVAV
jgi:hypothetical protein